MRDGGMVLSHTCLIYLPQVIIVKLKMYQYSVLCIGSIHKSRGRGGGGEMKERIKYSENGRCGRG